MRILLALLLALPVYNFVGFENLPIFICAVCLQILAGIDIRFSKEK